MMELLLPAGNPEAFFAAIEGGADSVYLGLRDFNARERADNFTKSQFLSILKEAHKNRVKIYLTLNTLLKNNELEKILDLLHFLSKTTLDAVIIQDLGILYLIQKFFPKLSVHASTQMGFHNSLAPKFGKKQNFQRLILARELTRSELSQIQKKSSLDLEIFAHGALCYSFSGMCLFSSFLGGMSANRGKCRQPCRRSFLNENRTDFFFSLKDLQLIDLIPELKKMKIASIKIEGRMKSAEYVYRVARAYRMVIEDDTKLEQAKKLLRFDLSREKTSYFIGGKVQNAITENPYLGLLIGEITESFPNKFVFQTSHPLRLRNRIRLQPISGRNTEALKIKHMEIDHQKVEKANAGAEVTIFDDKITAGTGDRVFLIGLNENNFNTKLRSHQLPPRFSAKKRKNILAKIGSKKHLLDIQIFVRIDQLKWLRKVYFESFSYLVLNFQRSEWKKFAINKPFLQKNISKIIIQLPKFIPENELSFYQNLIKNYIHFGVTNFMIAQISQKELFPASNKIMIYTSENVYCLNDATIQYLKEENIYSHVYPLENDRENLRQGKDRKGIVPLYFHPELFYSRMPIKMGKTSNSQYSFQDRDNIYEKHVRNGITMVVPKLPVSLLQYKDELFKQGFRRFLIDLSYDKPSQNTFNRLLKFFHNSQAEQPSSVFNFKSGLN